MLSSPYKRRRTRIKTTLNPKFSDASISPHPRPGNHRSPNLIMLYTGFKLAPRPGAVLAPAHLLFFSTLLGTELYQSFVMTKVCYQALPRSAFTTLQKHVFPLYFKGQTVLLLLAAATVPSQGPFALLQSKLDWIPFAVAGLTAVLNLVVYEPRTRSAMAERIHQG